MKSGSREFIQNLFCNFWRFLQVSTNFGSLPYFLEFKIIEKRFKTAAQCRAENRPTTTVHGPHGWPGGSAQPWRRLTRCMCATHGHCAQTACRTTRSLAASRRQGSQLEHHRHVADAPSKVGRGAAHRGGRSLVEWRGAVGAAVFRRRRVALEGGEDSDVDL
jgi:hypothetical protein